jgi:hypothetical protein
MIIVLPAIEKLEKNQILELKINFPFATPN